MLLVNKIVKMEENRYTIFAFFFKWDIPNSFIYNS